MKTNWKKLLVNSAVAAVTGVGVVTQAVPEDVAWTFGNVGAPTLAIVFANLAGLWQRQVRE